LFHYFVPGSETRPISHDFRFASICKEFFGLFASFRINIFVSLHSTFRKRVRIREGRGGESERGERGEGRERAERVREKEREKERK
jgi:hypothetical protein